MAVEVSGKDDRTVGSWKGRRTRGGSNDGNDRKHCDGRVEASSRRVKTAACRVRLTHPSGAIGNRRSPLDTAIRRSSPAARRRPGEGVTSEGRNANREEQSAFACASVRE